MKVLQPFVEEILLGVGERDGEKDKGQEQRKRRVSKCSFSLTL
jgi:hypothetical protein